MQHLHSIFVSTYAVLFLGTPHNGSSKASLVSVGRRMIDALVPSKVWDTDGQLLDALQEGSETLQNINDMFTPLMKNFRIYFFWEQEKTDFGVSQGYVCHICRVPLQADSDIGRWWKRVLPLPSWTIRSGLVFPMITDAWASLRVETHPGTGWSLLH